MSKKTKLFLMTLVIGLMSASVWAAPPPCQTVTVEGNVTSFRTGPNGETNGFFLFLSTASGSREVKFPSHLSAQVRAIITLGDDVRVTGCAKSGPGGSKIEAQSITNIDTELTVTNAPGERPPPVPCQSTIFSGTLTAFKISPKGQTDGFFVTNGTSSTQVKFPPSYGSQIRVILAVGNAVSVTGCLHTRPAGDTRIHAEIITNTQTGESVTISPPEPPGTCTATETRTGTLTAFRTTPSGQSTDGFFLNTGASSLEVRYPPYVSNQVMAIVSVGGQVIVTGCLRTGPAGNTRIHAQTITNTSTGQSLTIP
jgi:hypothetical protein